MLDPSSSSEDTGGDSDPEVVQEPPRKPVGSSAGKRGPNNRAGGHNRHQHRQQPGAPAGAPGKAAKHGGSATGEREEEEEEEEEEDERKERERIQKEEEERKIKLQIYVFVLRCISYPFNAKQPTDMARRQQKVNKQQLQAVKERFLAFLNGETQIVADEAFCNAVRSYYEDRHIIGRVSVFGNIEEIDRPMLEVQVPVFITRSVGYERSLNLVTSRRRIKALNAEL
ncbi:calcium-dependent secretion activator 2 isoform X6 [Scomber scombrus]|uniref:Calcium-dependent secretion activator 2 isoform X6 n=1 Tax=Scomber scombrus TaxID=13677 RepID=A0AAV1PWH7_SCOSC